MKKAIKALIAFLFMIIIVSGSIAAEKNNKPKIKTVDNYIAVFDFEVTTSDKGITRPLTESVRREIVLSGKYKVIDRGNMEKILGEQKLQMSGCVTGECIVEAGQLLGVGKLISGTVSMVGKTYYLTLSLISVKTGEIENVAEDTCKCEVDELLGSTKRLTKKLLGEKVEQRLETASKPDVAAKPPALDQKDQSELIKNQSQYFQIVTLAGGQQYEGDIVNGMRNGQGTLTFPSGEKYVGEWVNDKYSGHGTFTLPSGEKYVGEFRDSKYSGQGTFTLPSGEKYVGEFRDSKYNGQGTLTFPSGEKYVGEFRDSKRNGQGTFTFPDGRVLNGRWENDVFKP